MLSEWDFSVAVEASKLASIPSSLTAEGVMFGVRSSEASSGDVTSSRRGNKHSYEVMAFLAGELTEEADKRIFLTYELGDKETRLKRSRRGSNAQKNRFREDLNYHKK